MELHVTISDDYSQGHLEQDAVKVSTNLLRFFLITVEYEKIIIISADDKPCFAISEIR